MSRLAALLLLAAGCTPQFLEDNARAWRENECFQFPDTPRRERCLKEARQLPEDSKRQ